MCKWYQNWETSMNKDTLKILIQKFVPTKEIYTFTIDEIKEFRLGKNFIYELIDIRPYKVPNKLDLYRELNKELNKIELNNSSTAFRKDFSYLDLFEPHRKNYNFLRLDIRSFFHSIQESDIREVFEKYIPRYQYIAEEGEISFLDTFISIVTYEVPEQSINKKFRGKRILPMGFLTSPVISNIIFRQLDIQIQKLCSVNKVTYTRYADDMLFSSSENLNYLHTDSFIQEVQTILFQMKFKLNNKKTLKAKHTLALNGYILQYSEVTDNEHKIINELRLSNKKTKIINKMIYMINDRDYSAKFILKKLFKYQIKLDVDYEEIIEKYNREQLLNKILGYRSYLLSLIQFDKKYHCMQSKTITKYSDLINELEEISKKYQQRIESLEKKIQNKKFLSKISQVSIASLVLSDWKKRKLWDAGYETLYDLHEVREDELIYKIDGVGKVKAIEILKIIENEIQKYK